MSATQTAHDHEVTTPKAEYTFARFVKGEGNVLACSAAQAVADAPGRAYNPLFVYGSVGLGKTHLLHAIDSQIREAHPWENVVYITSERFAIELVNGIRNNQTERFRQHFRNADVLLIDDVHFLKDKTGTQEELLHTFNELHEAGKQVVLSSDRPPEELSSLQERLVSRFQWGLVADIQPPNYETRLAILHAKARANGFAIDEWLLELLAQRVTSSVRALEGALIRVTAHADLQGQPLSEATADSLVPADAVAAPQLDIDAIKAEVARRYGVTVDEIEGDRRTKRISQARHIAIYLARELTDSSYPAIGRAFGRRDHTTVMHACRKVSNMTQTPLFTGEIETLKRALRDGSSSDCSSADGVNPQR